MKKHLFLRISLAVAVLFSTSFLSALEPEALVGDWTNIDDGTSSTIRLKVIERGGIFFLKTWGAGTRNGVRAELPHDIRKMQVTGDPGSPISMTATWDTGFSIIDDTITTEDGAIVMETSTKFTDDSGRKPYTVKEYFVPKGEGE
jgi:hypothetical protein